MRPATTRRRFARSLACGLAPVFFPVRLRSQTAAIDETQSSAVRFLVGAQSGDGAWRSTVRGVFRDGDALTPLVLRALCELPEPLQPRDAIKRGSRWMRELAGRVQSRSDSANGLRYPLFTACHATRLGHGAGPADLWTNLLQRLQFSAELGWPESDARRGGWSDAMEPVRFTGATELADLNNPNLSATACALDGLAGEAHREVRRGALGFVVHCQNYRSGAGHDDTLDDGGFFFALDDPVRNKAGCAGLDADDHRRFRSYGSATCDGLLCLAACGLPPDHPRIQAAVGWLRHHAGDSPHPGNWPPGRQTASAGLDFYFAQAWARTLRVIQRSLPAFRPWSGEMTAQLRASLLARQNADGSWVNPVPESFEDDPLLTTAFALRALAADNSV